MEYRLTKAEQMLHPVHYNQNSVMDVGTLVGLDITLSKIIPSLYKVNDTILLNQLVLLEYRYFKTFFANVPFI